MIELKTQKVLGPRGKVKAFLINKNDYLKLEDYIEDLEDSIELADSIKNAYGFILWEDFVNEYKRKSSSLLLRYTM